MARLNLTMLFVAVILAMVPHGLAGPACARRSQGQDSCVTQCGNRWGWRGRTMGTDRWGQVMTISPSDTDLASVVRSECSLSTQSSASSSAVVSASQVPPINVGSQSPVVSTLSVSSTLMVTSSPVATIIPPSSQVISDIVTPSSSLVGVSTNAPSSTPLPSSPSQKPSSPVNPSPSTPVSSSPSASPSKSSSPSPSPSPSTQKVSSSSAAAAASSSAVSASSVSSSDIQQYLNAHNTVRAQHGADALTWDNTLSSKAQEWANKCVFEHSGGSLGPYGENLSAGTGSFSIASAVKAWTDEASSYDPSNPQPSHFTQVVWKSTTQLGCAVASCDGIFDASYGKAQFYVCEYNPAGNYLGEFAENVQA